MGEDDGKTRATELANLRLEVNALASKMDAVSLPDALRALRRTVMWAAIGVAAALVLDGLLHQWGTARLERLERRVEHLEHLQPGSGQP